MPQSDEDDPCWRFHRLNQLRIRNTYQTQDQEEYQRLLHKQQAWARGSLDREAPFTFPSSPSHPLTELAEIYLRLTRIEQILRDLVGDS